MHQPIRHTGALKGFPIDRLVLPKPRRVNLTDPAIRLAIHDPQMLTRTPFVVTALCPTPLGGVAHALPRIRPTYPLRGRPGLRLDGGVPAKVRLEESGRLTPVASLVVSVV